MKLTLTLYLFAAVAQASRAEISAIAENLVRSEDGMLHVGRDGVLRSFSGDLEVLDAAPLKRDAVIAESGIVEEDIAITVRSMLNPTEDIVNEVRELRENARKMMKRGLAEKRSCGGYCDANNRCSLLNEQRCQSCIGSRCGG